MEDVLTWEKKKMDSRSDNIFKDHDNDLKGDGPANALNDRIVSGGITKKYPNGAVYRGGFLKGVPHGEGEFLFTCPH